MKKLYIIDEYESSQKNGLGVFVKELIKCLNSANTEINLLDINVDTEEFSIEQNHEIRRFCFPKLSGNPFSDYAEVLDAFFRLYIEDSKDNVFILNQSPCKNLILAIRDSHPLSKIIFVIHDFSWTLAMHGNVEKFKELMKNRAFSETDHKPLFESFDEEVRMYNLVDKVVCLCKDSHKMLTKTYKIDKNKITLIPNGLSNSYNPISENKKKKLRVEKHIGEDEKVMIYIGRVNRIKGGLALVTCFEEILKKYPNTRLVVLGSLMDPKNILELGKNISSKITFTGHLSKSEIKGWYHIADIGLIPSYIEQCSYSGIEMMMYGLPIIASDGFGVRCMFQDGENAKIASIGNRGDANMYIKNLTAAIIDILSSNKLQDELRIKSRKAYEGKKWSRLIYFC